MYLKDLIPEYKPSELNVDEYKDGWNDCIDEIKRRLNQQEEDSENGRV